MLLRRSRPVFLLSVTALLATWTGAAGAEGGATTAPPKPTTEAAAPEAKKGASTQREHAAQADAKRREAEAQRQGDTGLAQRLAALSARWLRVIDALERAVVLETQANVLEDERIAVQEQTDRTVTLLEQTEARRARALARLQALGLEPTGIPQGAPAPGTAPAPGAAPPPSTAPSPGTAAPKGAQR